MYIHSVMQKTTGRKLKKNQDYAKRVSVLQGGSVPGTLPNPMSLSLLTSRDEFAGDWTQGKNSEEIHHEIV